MVAAALAVLLEATISPPPAPGRQWYPAGRLACVDEPGRLVTNALVNVARAERGCTTSGDDRIETRAYAVKRYLHRRSQAAGSARFACSVAQLVTGLAPIMGWDPPPRARAEREKWVRAHRKSVVRWLDDLQAAGLLQYTGERDNRGQLWRTIITLQATPDPPPEQLRAARRRLRAFKKRARRRQTYRRRRAQRTRKRRAHTALEHVLALSAQPRHAARARLAVQRARRVREARRRDQSHEKDRTHPFGAPPTGEEQLASRNSQTHGDTDACGAKTRVTRARAHDSAVPGAAPNSKELLSSEEERLELGAGSRGPLDVQALLRRVAARESAREAVLGEIAVQAGRRASDVAGWGTGRGWPIGRVREAWVVARHGAAAAAQTGPAAAGRLRPEDEQRLRRAAVRYEKHAAARPEGMPAGALAALLELAVTRGSQWLGQDVLALDRLSKRMRAHAATRDPTRLQRLTARAERRWRAPEPGQLVIASARPAGPWPAWVVLDADGKPRFKDGELLVDRPPASGSPGFRQVVRDAHLLAGLAPPVETDGAQERDLRARGLIPPAHRPVRRTPQEHYAHLEALELQQLVGIPAAAAARLQPELRTAMLRDARRHHAEQQHAEQQAFLDRVRDNAPADEH